MPVVAVLAADFLFGLAKTGQLRTALLLLSALVVVYVVYVNLAVTPAQADFIREVYWSEHRTRLYLAWMGWPLVVSAIVAGVASRFGKMALSTGLVVGVLAVVAGWQIVVLARQARAPYSTTYHYGESSLRETAECLRRTLPPEAVVLAPKDLGDLLWPQWRYIELGSDPTPVLDWPGLQYVAHRTDDYYGNTIRETRHIAEAVGLRFAPIERIGNFVILRRR
jgi:hypothetical protein